MLELANISKQYGPVVANRNVGFTAAPGEVVGLLGENGAGKSTLLSILASRIRPDSGTVTLNGQPLDLSSPQAAIRHGISAVYQHFSLIETFTIREQLRLAGWTSDHLPPTIAQQFSGNERIGALSPGERQAVEIAKALIANPRVLLLDEPTSILAPAEVDHLFRHVRELRDRGITIIFVTHKLNEALEVCDRIVVLRRGEVSATIERANGSWQAGVQQDLLHAMFGAQDTNHEAELPKEQRTLTPDSRVPPLFEATYHPDGSDAVHSLTLNAQEILAIVGVDGQGQRDLAEFCTGYKASHGDVRLHDRSLNPGHPHLFLESGITWLTGDRIGEGSVPDLSVASNLLLKRQRERPFSRKGWLDRAAITGFAERQVREWNITARSPHAPIRELSGGNVQKVLLARELPMATSVLIATNPTQGLDVQSQRAVWNALQHLAAQGSGVAVFTTELDEAVAYADRVAVMFNGELSGAMPVRPGIRPQLERMMTAGW